MTETKISKSPFSAERFIQERTTSSDKLNTISRKLESLLDPSVPVTRQIKNFFNLSADERTFLQEFSNDTDLATAAVINVQSVRGKTRKSGRAYASHPAQVANTCLELATDISSSARKRSAEVALVHDVIEEDTLPALKKGQVQAFSYFDFSQVTLSKTAAIAQAREKLNTLLPEANVGEAVVTLMEPLIPEISREEYLQQGFSDYLITYAYFGELLRGVTDGAVINAEIADRIDDILDLDYILGSSSDELTKQKKLTDKFAKCLFTVNYICYDHEGNLKQDVSKNLLVAFNMLLAHVVTSSEYTTMESIVTEASRYGEFINQNRQQVVSDLNEYLSATSSILRIK